MKARIILALFLLMAVLIAILGFSALKQRQVMEYSVKVSKEEKEAYQKTESYQKEKAVPDWEETWNIAVFGYFTVSAEGSPKQEDVLDLAAVVGIDRGSLTIRCEFIPLDRVILSADTGRLKTLKEIYEEQSYVMALKSLSKDLKIRFDDYFVFNWKDAVDEINLLEGVEIELTEEEFQHFNAFTTETVTYTGVPSTYLKNPGLNNLDGVQLCAYTRLRLSEEDNGQVQRRTYAFSQVWKKAMEGDASAVRKFCVELLKKSHTTIDKNKLKFLLENGEAWITH